MFIYSIIAWIYSNLIFLSISLISYFVVKEIIDEHDAKKKLPPGPRGLPLVGSLPFLGKEPSKTLVKYSKQYGSVFGLQLGTVPVLVLNDWPSIKEAFSKDVVSGRPEDSVFNSILPQISFGILSGPQWKEQRRFALHQLRNLGFGKASMEDHILDEINNLIEVIDKVDGKDFDLRKYLTPSVSNNINSLVFGHRLEYSDPNRQMLDKIFEPNPNINLIGVLAFFPALSRLVFKYLYFLMPSSLKKLRQIFHDIVTYIRNQINTHDKTINPENIRDYIDSFLNEMKQKNGQQTSFTREMLQGNIFMLFGAGSGTVITSLEWAFLVLATHPEIQKRIQQEIDEVIGIERSPKFSDRNQMPYLQAFMWELWRFRSITPINLPRRAMEETTIQGYKIPKDTQIMANFWAINNDPNLWDNPQQFSPNRFLSEDEKQFVNREYLIPFSYGKRSCPGESLGIVEVFLYLSCLLQKYDINQSPNTDLKLEYELLFTTAQKYPPIVCFTRRKQN